MNKILSVTLPVVAALAFGCGKSETHQTPDGKVKVEQKGDTTKYEIMTDEGKVAMTAGDTGVTVPDTFPKDVPILKGAMPQMSMSQGKSQTLHLRVPGSMADVAKEYQEKLKAEGWEIESAMNMGEASMLQAKKGNRQCTAMVMKDEDGTVMQLTITEE